MSTLPSYAMPPALPAYATEAPAGWTHALGPVACRQTGTPSPRGLWAEHAASTQLRHRYSAHAFWGKALFRRPPRLLFESKEARYFGYRIPTAVRRLSHLASRGVHGG
jgi:hypothetical protein